MLHWEVNQPAALAVRNSSCQRYHQGDPLVAIQPAGRGRRTHIVECSQTKPHPIGVGLAVAVGVVVAVTVGEGCSRSSRQYLSPALTRSATIAADAPSQPTVCPLAKCMSTIA